MIIAPLFNTTVTTDGGGNFSIPNFIEGNYEVYIGKWGYDQVCIGSTYLSPPGNPHIYTMDDGYYDDFTFDLGWTVTGNPNSGDWERDEPVGTTFSGFPSNPDEDSQVDCRDQAYITGNGGGGAGSDDIDGGQTTLTSPVFDLSTYGDPYIHFERWFFNAGGSGSPNDSLVVELSNGSSMVSIDASYFMEPNMGVWHPIGLQVSSVIAPTNNMTLRVRAMDIGPGHISEGGFDHFLVADSLTTSNNGNENVAEKLEISIYPAPFNDILNVNLNQTLTAIQIEIYDVTGKQIDSRSFKNSNTIQIENNYDSGVYILNVYGNGELLKTEKIIKL
jgi:hypothetical protein